MARSFSALAGLTHSRKVTSPLLDPLDPDRRLHGAGLQFRPALQFLELVQQRTALVLEAGHQVMVVPAAHQVQVRFAGEAPVHDHGESTLDARPLFQGIQHRFHRFPIGGVAGKDLVADGETIAIQHQAHGDLLAVSPHLFVVPALGLGNRRHLAFESGCW
jgi:hypothetical protein